MRSLEERMQFVRDVEAIVNSIPSGRVLTYGDVAALAGYPSCARQVGKILGSFGFDSAVPCHRVVNFQGRPAPHWLEQVSLLREEGVSFTKSNLVDMMRHHWRAELDRF